MIVLYLITALLLIVAVVTLLGLTPDCVTNDIMRLFLPEQTLHELSCIAHGRKKSHILTNSLRHIRDAMTETGKGGQFTLVCASSLGLMIAGCVLGVIIGNVFIIPVLSVFFALIPFLYAKKTISYYDKHVREEMETALSTITSSYVRSEDIIGAVRENLPYIKPPIRSVFQAFVGDATAVSASIKEALRNMKAKVDNEIFAEWCDALISCQDDRTVIDTLLPIVGKLTDVRIVNNELKTLLMEVRKEYWIMVGLVTGNVPLLYLINKDWFSTLLFSLPGKITVAVSGTVILVTAVLMTRYTRPIEYKK